MGEHQPKHLRQPPPSRQPHRGGGGCLCPTGTVRCLWASLESPRDQIWDCHAGCRQDAKPHTPPPVCRKTSPWNWYPKGGGCWTRGSPRPLPTLFCSEFNPAVPLRFWPAIDDHFRKVAYEKRVRLRLLVGCWRHSKPNMFPFLRSLAALQDNRTHYSLEVVRGPDGILPPRPRETQPSCSRNEGSACSFLSCTNLSGSYSGAEQGGVCLCVGGGIFLDPPPQQAPSLTHLHSAPHLTRLPCLPRGSLWCPQMRRRPRSPMPE